MEFVGEQHLPFTIDFERNDLCLRRQKDGKIMTLDVTIQNASKISDGIWLFEMPPHQVAQLSNEARTLGTKSIVQLGNPRFDQSKKQISLSIDDFVPLSIGTSIHAFGIAEWKESEISASKATQKVDNFTSGNGDNEFLKLVSEVLTPPVEEVARVLLQKIRAKSPGDLKLGKARNFSNTPDNFWYVRVQPRANDLSITVRGSVEHFSNVAPLELKDDRGNTRFKVKEASDIPAALDLIFHALRKF